MSVGELPPAPAEVALVAGDDLARERLQSYAEFLAGAGVERGLLGPREVPRLWDRHLLNCAVVAPLVPQGAHVIDVGSGAGLPGLVWAIVRPDITLTCLESLQRRATYLDEAIAALGLGDRVAVVRARAEDVARGRAIEGSLRADVVTARAVAALDKLAGWTVPLLTPGGELLAVKGQSATEEVESARAIMDRLGIKSIEIVQCGVGIVDPPTTVVRARKAP
ncbi:MAG: 16S rRNA (guanine(527)-N(7))-methyltransferase RsmG [Actinobacteria bacterium]|nr:16S rRNA (guanine(527)-N(7))-methyltransferase RsmG [Actinomycetota bacterium]